MSDEDLVRQFQEGAEAAFDELVERHRHRVYGLVCRLLGSAEAEDLAQEVFLAVYRSLGSFRGESRFATWLYRVTIHTCSHYRRRRRLETTELEGEEPDGRGEGDPERSALRQELCDRVREAIDALPYKLRLVIVLRDLHGLTYEEIATVVRCPIGTVRSRLHYATQRLAVALRSYVEIA